MNGNHMAHPRKHPGPSAKTSPEAGTKIQMARIQDSISRGELVVVVGSGISLALTNGDLPALSWTGLVRNGFAYGVKKGKITEAQAQNWRTQLESKDIDDLLCAAEFMGRKLDAPQGPLYANWLKSVFKSAKPSNNDLESAILSIHKLGIPICTLNYDNLIEDITKLSTINLHETVKTTAWFLRENTGVLHLHGSWDAPETCILGTRDYESTLTSEVRDLFQRSLGSFRRLLFIGCGDTFADPNFSALVSWLRENMKAATFEHYALVSEGEVPSRNADPSWHNFVEPIAYGAEHSDLPAFLNAHFATPRPPAPRMVSGPAKSATSKAEHDRLIAAYCAFLLRDCGQMAIEGVHADLDIGQRKFEIERLFVPLSVQACLPEIPDTDPQHEEKIRKWKRENIEPKSFGSVFKKYNRLALLALPGGGKTLLLKRLAVAYADPQRRGKSEDDLPELDLTPVLIRCREWREHIHNPILTILKKLPDITGDASLTGLSDALLPLLKSGRVLLLVDGLDEIHNDAHRSIFVEHLESFLDSYKDIRLVVTSREAGFDLVAPCISRFCERQHVAALSDEAINSLCNHWQRLMAGDSPEAVAEGKEVAQILLRNHSLRRLAENPLLLTMLLVVKHGAGRLPPDRVNLYSRAVEVLLDTWNIKGHDPLNAKEAIPQLAYIAFEMMRLGKQTATEKELLLLLNDARIKVDFINRYAKDAPNVFLKRVELRSSLLLEAGHQKEDGRTVPFYQFRHLTFQEYLAAVAAAEGHYSEYQQGDTVLTPLKNHLTSEEWKEVIPMAAVLARKQAEPLIAALVQDANELRLQIEAGAAIAKTKATKKIQSFPRSLPPSASRLVQCLIQEAEAAPKTLTSALQLAAFFADSSSNEDWSALSRGPYGADLLHQIWLLYSPMQMTFRSDFIHTYSLLAMFHRPWSQLSDSEIESELRILLSSSIPEEVTVGLLTCAGFVMPVNREPRRINSIKISQKILRMIEDHIYTDDQPTLLAAIYSYAHMLHFSKSNIFSIASTTLLDRLTFLRLHSSHEGIARWSGMALAEQSQLPLGKWSPTLIEAENQRIKANLVKGNRNQRNDYLTLGDLVIALHAKSIISIDEILVIINKELDRSKENRPNHSELQTRYEGMLKLLETPSILPPILNKRPIKNRKNKT